MYSFTNIFPYIIKSNFCIFFLLFGLFLFVCWVGVCCVCLAMASFSRTIVCKTTHRTSFSVCCAWAHIFSHIFSSLRFRCLSGLMIPSFFIVFFRDIFFSYFCITGIYVFFVTLYGRGRYYTQEIKPKISI